MARPLVDIDSYDGDMWGEMAFSEAVQINPKVLLSRGSFYPFLGMADVNSGSRSALPSEEREYKGGGSRFLSGDTLMARITPCLENGKVARYQCHGEKSEAHGSTEFIVIRGRPDVTDSEYAYYLTQWEEVRNYAISQMTGTSGRQRVPTDSLDSLFVPVPPLSEQRAIAHILGTLDDKIELNRRVNQTLEEIARAIFKDWFIDFGPTRAKMEGREPYLPAEVWDLFPDSLVDSELGPIPDGWELKALEEVVQLNPVERMKRGTEAPYLNMAALPTSGPNAADAIQRAFTSGTRFRNGDTLLARITPCLENGKTAYIQSLPADAVGWGSTEFVVMRAVPPTPPEYTYLLARDEAFRTHAIQSMTGTSGRQRAQKESLASYRVAFPNGCVWDAFASRVEPLLSRIGMNASESRSLASLRDTLLPRLVSGKLRVVNVQALSEGSP